MANDDPFNGAEASAVHWRDRGIELRKQGRPAEAAQALRRALSLAGDDAVAWSELAHALRWQGNLTEAQQAAERAIGLHPNHAPAWFNLGAVFAQQGDNERGIEAYRKALQWQPDFAEAWSNLGLALCAGAKREEGIAAFNRALAINPGLIPVWNNLGGALSEAGRWDDAIAAYKRAVAIAPDYAQGWSNLADGYCETGQFALAVNACEQALHYDPNLAAAWHNLGNAKMATGELSGARAAFERALELDPRVARTWSTLGALHLRQGATDEAIAAQRRATELAPGDARCWRSLAHALMVGNRLGDSIEALSRAVALQPAQARMRADLVYQKLAICDWHDLDAQQAILGTGVDGMPPGEEETPHGNLMRCDDEACNLAVARRWAGRVSARFAPAFTFDDRAPAADRRIVIGYLSSDMHDHATAHLLRGVFRQHDHARFRIHVYSHGPEDGSSIRAAIRAASDLFRDIRALCHREAAAQIAADGVDILVDLKGWTQGVRYEICALRPAPLQITYLGFPGSCGARFIDYAIVDPVVVPAASAVHYSEQLIYLPHCYQANDDQQPIEDTVTSRAEYGLPEHGAVLSSFNANQKLDPVIFGVWMHILQRAPDAVLWLLASNRWAMDNLTAQARAHGIAAERVIFAQSMSRDRHQRRLRMADLALDTRMCNGHTTTSDSLWAGVPVLTLRGRHFASRVSASCLAAIGMPELVAGSLQEYEDLAVRFATDQDFLRATTIKLQHNRRSYPLFDTARFTRNLERAYLQAWQRHQSGRQPETFSIHDAEPLHGG